MTDLPSNNLPPQNESIDLDRLEPRDLIHHYKRGKINPADLYEKHLTWLFQELGYEILPVLIDRFLKGGHKLNPVPAAMTEEEFKYRTCHVCGTSFHTWAMLELFDCRTLTQKRGFPR